jgi:hypothetical protein
MMDILSGLISNLLLEHDCVIVPGLGGFITKYKPATIHPYHHTFHPPSKQVMFNSALIVNDGLLAKAYALSAGVDYNEATQFIETYVQSIKISLLKGNKIVLEKIGVLRLNKENNIHFTPDSFANYLADSYGLDTFDFHPVNSYDDNSTIKINNPLVRKTLRWAAILLPVAAIAMWTIFNRSNIYDNYTEYASVVPSAVELKTNAPEEVVTKPLTQPLGNDVATKVAEKPESTVASEQPVSKTYQVKEQAVAEIIPSKNIINSNYHIIAGAFSVAENAARLAEQLKSQGYDASVVGKNNRSLHIVSIASYTTKAKAMNGLTEIQKKGFSGAWLFENRQ